MAISSFSYATNMGTLPLGASIVAEQSMQDTIKKVTTLEPVENINITVFANTIAGPVKKLTTTSCINAVEFLKPRVGDTPMMIWDGGYNVYIEQNEKKFQLSSQKESLFSWMKRCENLK